LRFRSGSSHVLAVGDEAKRMLGRTPGNIVAVRPLKDGVIADFEMTEAMLRHSSPRSTVANGFDLESLLLCPPELPKSRNARSKNRQLTPAHARVYLIEEPMAAAIGVGLPVQDAAGNMIIDIGGGTTEVALISLSGIVFSRSVRVAGDELDEAVAGYMKRAYNLMIGDARPKKSRSRLAAHTQWKRRPVWK